MSGHLTVHFAPDQEFVLNAASPLPGADTARQWLDEQFLEFDCEPLRASGKVLVADKLLAIAEAAGAQAFGAAGDAAWAARFAAAACAATGRAVVRLDVPSAQASF
ncbi:hypothetical protein [Sphaerotilus uruguayifluvii]|uniref:Uncharacterized protein n=1 Tax=Sphaerotilus uruguayifluvii TaxID=2735897 RepID=A0ABX2GAB1_9BURK|nr:hypothetical protein [Leptothrix sp. C29]NRT58508.1 hypothetical protein [Leptothrix sp. C29]